MLLAAWRGQRERTEELRAAMIQAGEEADDDTWCTAAPSGYANLLQKTTDVAGAATWATSSAHETRRILRAIRRRLSPRG